MRPSIWSATLLFALTVLTLILLRPLTPIDETRFSYWRNCFFSPTLSARSRMPIRPRVPARQRPPVR